MGILNSIYSALDPVLPFDKYLDPRLGGRGMAAQAPQTAQAIPAFMRPPGAVQQAPAPAAPSMVRKGPSLVDTIFGVAAGYSPGMVRRMYSDDDTRRAREEEARALQAKQRDTLMAFAETLDPRQRAVFLSNPGKWAEEAAVGYRPQIAAPGSSAYVDGKFTQAPLAPIEVTAGSAVFDPNSKAELYRAPIKPEIITTSPGETATLVDPGGPQGNPRSPEVGQFIYGQLQGVPGLKLGNPGVRSEAEIASLPLSAKDTYHRQGAALDFTAPGQDPQAVIATVRAKMGPGYDVIYHPENGSFHVEPGPGWQGAGSGGPSSRVVASGGPKPQWTSDGQFQYSPDGKREALPQRTMAPAVQKAEDEDLEAIDTAGGIIQRLEGYQEQIRRGDLNFGPISNLVAGARLATGTADANALNYGSFKSDLEKLRNDSLRLNSGVQTEGDAQRAWNELFANINDEKFVLKRLGEIAAMNRRAIELKQQRIETRRSRNGFGAPAAPASPSATKPKPVKKDPFPGIAQGQVVVQGGVRYRRQGDKMIEVR